MLITLFSYSTLQGIQQHLTNFFTYDYMTTTILTILSIQKYIKTLSSGIIRFWAHTSHHIRVDFFFSMFFCFLVFDDPHLFFTALKSSFTFCYYFLPSSTWPSTHMTFALLTVSTVTSFHISCNGGAISKGLASHCKAEATFTWLSFSSCLPKGHEPRILGS